MDAEGPVRMGGWLARLRPSPAMAVAGAALFVALGGVGYAATTIGSEEIRNNSIENVDVKNDDLLSRDIKDGTILRRDISPSALNIQDDTVLSRDIKDETLLSRDLADGTILRRDISPTALESLEGPRAFARVSGIGTGFDLVDESNSKGVAEADVSNPSDGIYCFTGLGFDPTIAIATREPTVPDTVTVVSAIAFDSSFCAGDEQAAVLLVRRDDGAPVNGRFYVMFE